MRFYLGEINRQDLIGEIPELNLWLEFGVSQTTQLSLLSIGLSRNTVIAISEYITRTDLSKEKVINWLIATDLEAMNLSPIMNADIHKTIKKEKTINDNT